MRSSVAQQTRQSVAILAVKLQRFVGMQFAEQNLINDVSHQSVIKADPAMLLKQPEAVVPLATTLTEVVLTVVAPPYWFLLFAVTAKRWLGVVCCRCAG